MVLIFLLSCDVELRGRVTEAAGAPVAGAQLEATEGLCSAVTDAAGEFATRCLRGDYHFVVTHPSHAASAVHIDATGTLAPEPAVATLVAWPSEAGLYLEPEYVRLPDLELTREIDPAEQRFCLPEGAALPAAMGEIHVFDVHATDWRLFPVGADGCAYRLGVEPGGRYWSPRSARVEPTSVTELALGRVRVTFTLPPGRYVAAPWFEGFFVPKDPSADTWSAWAFEVTAPAEAAPAAP